MNLSTVYLGYTAKITAIFTLIVLLCSIFTASFALANEDAPVASSTPVKYACEIEVHKYNEKGTPLEGWTIGLMKVLKFTDREETLDLVFGKTGPDGYYCLEWDGYTNTEVVEEPHSFTYRVYEVLKEGWKFWNVEEGKDVPSLKEVADEDIKEANGRVSVQIGETNGYIFANAEHHVDFYNKEIDTEIKPCEDPCGGGNGGGNGGGGNGGSNDNDRNSNSSGTRIKRAPAGEVLGASTTTPAGQVLGDATSAMPVGAPNTGAGGTAPVSVSLPTLVAILSTTTRRIK